MRVSLSSFPELHWVSGEQIFHLGICAKNLLFAASRLRFAMFSYSRMQQMRVSESPFSHSFASSRRLAGCSKIKTWYLRYTGRCDVRRTGHLEFSSKMLVAVQELVLRQGRGEERLQNPSQAFRCLTRSQSESIDYGTDHQMFRHQES